MKTKHIIEFNLDNSEKEKIEQVEQTITYLANILSYHSGFARKLETLDKAQEILRDIRLGRLENH